MSIEGIHIEGPTEGDWPWIIERHAETAWASLPPELQSALTIQAVGESLAGQTTSLRDEHGATNQVLIARSVDGQRAGYVWVGQVRSGFTGAMQAYILNLFVAQEFRGQGIGALLMSRAENWAREHGLMRIGLGVAAHNTSAISLYEKLDYETETLRMFKTITGEAS